MHGGEVGTCTLRKGISKSAIGKDRRLQRLAPAMVPTKKGDIKLMNGVTGPATDRDPILINRGVMLWTAPLVLRFRISAAMDHAVVSI
jgi:hypothetical protein